MFVIIQFENCYQSTYFANLWRSDIRKSNVSNCFVCVEHGHLL